MSDNKAEKAKECTFESFWIYLVCTIGVGLFCWWLKGVIHNNMAVWLFTDGFFMSIWLWTKLPFALLLFTVALIAPPWKALEYVQKEMTPNFRDKCRLMVLAVIYLAMVGCFVCTMWDIFCFGRICFWEGFYNTLMSLVAFLFSIAGFVGYGYMIVALPYQIVTAKKSIVENEEKETRSEEKSIVRNEEKETRTENIISGLIEGFLDD